MRPNRAIPVSILVLLAMPACEQIVHLGGGLGGASGLGTGGIGVGGAGGSGGGVGAAGAAGAGAIGPLLWTATFESGDMSEWLADGEGGVAAVNVTTNPSVTTEFAHSGRYSGKTVLMPSSKESFEWLYRDTPSPPEAYYSAWFYIPIPYAVKTWLSIMHFQGSHTNDGRNTFPTWDINLNPQPDGSLTAQLFNFVTMKPLFQAQPIPVPIGKWVHFEMLLKKATTATGGVAVWQDGTAILKVDDVITVEHDWSEWMVGSSADGITPSVGAVYVDDAAISLTRLGPGG
jgi:hypothetical protein